MATTQYSYADLMQETGEEPTAETFRAAIRQLREGDRLVLYHGDLKEWRSHDAGVIVRLGDPTRSLLLLCGLRTIHDAPLAEDWHVDADLNVWDARRFPAGLDFRRNGDYWQLRHDDSNAICAWSVLPSGMHLVYAAPLASSPRNKSVIRVPICPEGSMRGQATSVFHGDAEEVRFLFDTFAARRPEPEGPARWIREGGITIGFGDPPIAQPHPHGFVTSREVGGQLQLRFNGEVLYEGPGDAWAPHPHGVVVQDGQRLTLVVRHSPSTLFHLDESVV